MLTIDEWAAQKAPIYWVDLPKWVEHDNLIRNLIDKWCDANLDDWWYRDFHTFVFGSEKDRTTFLMFYKSGMWSESDGEILPQ